MTKTANFGVAWHVQVTVCCFVAMAMTTLTQTSDAASDRSWTKVWSNGESDAGSANHDEAASRSSPNVTVITDVKSSIEIFSGYTEQEKVEHDELQTNSPIEENQKKVETDSNSKCGSELVVQEQNTTAESSQFNTTGDIIMTRNIVITIWNQIPGEVIKVECQSLKDSTVVNDFGLIFIASKSQHTWRTTEVEHRPNVVKCLFYWDRGDSYMEHLVYQDTTFPQSNWYVDVGGLYTYGDLGLTYLLVQSWQRELQI